MGDLATAEIVHIAAPDDCATLCQVLADVWGFSEPTGVASCDTLRALAYSGGYVAGVVVDGRIIGGGFGWPTSVAGEWRLHSHVIGFLDGYRGLGLGGRIKHHQRDFVRDNGLAAVEWTYDPLHAVNARFNLNKLGARVLSFHHDFYGEMKDTFSAGLGSDRFLVRWGIDDEPRAADADRPSILRVGARGEPMVTVSDAPAVRAQIPSDIVTIRREDKALAIAWRDAFASTVGGALDDGGRVVGIAADWSYFIDR